MSNEPKTDHQLSIDAAEKISTLLGDRVRFLVSCAVQHAVGSTDRNEFNQCIEELIHWGRLATSLTEAKPNKPAEVVVKNSALKNRCLKCYAPAFIAQGGCCDSCKKLDAELEKIAKAKEGK